MASWLETNDCLYLRPAWIGRIFLTSDVITFLVQLGGSGMAAEQSLAATGEKVSLPSCLDFRSMIDTARSPWLA